MEGGNGDSSAPAPSPVNAEKLARLQRMAVNVRTGGKGSVRRKKKAIHKASPTDDKRLQSTIKRLGLNSIPGIEEVNLFKDDGQVINFSGPKVQASIGANTYVISGKSAIKSVDEVLPDLMSGMGATGLPSGLSGGSREQMAQLQQLMAQVQASGGPTPDMTAAMKAAGLGDFAGASAEDDDVPDLVDNQTFEDAAEVSKDAEDKPPPLEDAESKEAA